MRITLSFRPLAGIWWGKQDVTLLIQDTQEGFRPLAGIWWGKFFHWLCIRNSWLLFPSPCGDLVGKDEGEDIRGGLTFLTFPSPCGDLVGKGSSMGSLSTNLLLMRFRPLAGIWWGKIGIKS